MNTSHGAEAPRLDAKLTTMIAVAVVALVAVVAGAFVLSFAAITAVSEAAHIDAGLSWLMATSVDGAMTVGTMTALVLKMLGRKTGYAWFVVLAGVTISIACNALHATQSVGTDVTLEGWQQGAVSAIPAVALALSLHLLILLIEAISDTLSSRRQTAKDAPEVDASPRTEAAVRAGARVSVPTSEPAREPVPEPVRTELPAPVRTPEPPRTEPVRTDGGSLVQGRPTEIDKSRTNGRTGHEARPETPRTATRNTSRPAATSAATTVKPPKTLAKTQSAPVDRDDLVDELASEIRALGDDWKPDYDALMARAGFGRSWCEKVVKEARATARLDKPATPRMAAPYGLHADGGDTRTEDPYDTRTGGDTEPRTDDDETPRTEPVRAPLRVAN
ncbi:DUF2637 domain-containing protein [Nonomuraea sp. CA-143628]|uniref:DUF2637 domain-containing protein n=1 Tax=Nonomuraea sp. CA-143628 TaxID=3239997 RepID=UPI003D92C87C